MKGIVTFIAGLLLLFPLAGLAQVNEPDSLGADSIVVPLIKGKGSGNDTIPAQSGIQRPPADSAGGKPKADKPVERKEQVIKPKEEPNLRKHNPRTAAWMSAALPGLGQIYNKKYWKLPIVYVGLGVCGYFAWTNTVEYRKYKETYRYRVGVDSLATDWFPNETDNTVLEMKEYHHKNIEISYIAAGVIYLLNIVDATVDAHLYDFDVNDNLSLRIEPVMNPSLAAYGPGSGTGIKLSLKF